MLKKNGFIVIIAVIIGVIVLISSVFKKNNNELELKEYREYLRGLSAEEVIYEHFKNKNEQNIPKLKETIVKEQREFNWKQRNLDFIKILEISLNCEETKKYASINNEYIGAKVYDVTYHVEYSRNGPQSSGEYVWKYYVLKKNQVYPWLIASFGF